MILSNHRINILFLLLAVCLLTVSLACAEEFDRPLLFLNLPGDAQMIENVQFDDGDFIQTYQLSGGAHITLLRYADFNMSVHDLLTSEWDGARSISGLDLDPISGQKTEGIRFSYSEADDDTLLITLITITAGKDTLVFEAVYPERNGEDQVNAIVDGIIRTMQVITMSESNLG